MRGRISGVKKTKLLRISAMANATLALAFILLSIFYFKRPELWFFFFLVFCGLHSLIRAFLFHSDSSCYFGLLLLFCGVIGIVNEFIVFQNQAPFYLFGAALASLITTLMFKQLFQLFIGVILGYEAIILALYQYNIINLTIFLPLNVLLLFPFLFFCVILIKKFKRRSQNV